MMKKKLFFCAILAVLVNSTFGIEKDSLAKLHFQKACSFSLENTLDSALHYCKLAAEDNYPGEHILTDTDLENLQQNAVSWEVITEALKAQYSRRYPSMTKPDLGYKLWLVYIEDQRFRTLKENYKKGELPPFDNDALKKRIETVSGIIESCGWLGYSEVGIEGGDALFLVIQHSYPNTNTMQKYLPLMIAKANEGEASKINTAKMIDRHLSREYGLQLYGTQIICKTLNGTKNCQLYPIIDEEKLNERRKKLGLESIEAYLKDQNLSYTPPQNRTDYTPVKLKKKYIRQGYLSILAGSN